MTDSIINISWFILWIVVLFNLVLTFGLVRRLSELQNHSGKGNGRISLKTLEVGKTAPNFTASSLSGESVSLINFLESTHNTVLVFISPNCGPCREKMRNLNHLYPLAKRFSVELVTISLGDVNETMKLVNDFHFTAPILIAPPDTNSLNSDYGVPGTPFYYLIDQDRTIKLAGPFDSTWESLVKTWEENLPTIVS